MKNHCPGKWCGLDIHCERRQLMGEVKDIEFSENGFIVKTLHGEQLAQS